MGHAKAGRHLISAAAAIAFIPEHPGRLTH